MDVFKGEELDVWFYLLNINPKTIIIIAKLYILLYNYNNIYSLNVLKNIIIYRI